MLYTVVYTIYCVYSDNKTTILFNMIIKGNNMNIEEIIDNLKYMISEQCTDTQYDFQDEINFAIRKLEKEVPIKPIRTKRPYNGDEIIICCECSSIVKDGEWSAKYCPNCSQKINWKRRK